MTKTISQRTKAHTLPSRSSRPASQNLAKSVFAQPHDQTDRQPKG